MKHGYRGHVTYVSYCTDVKHFWFLFFKLRRVLMFVSSFNIFIYEKTSTNTATVFIIYIYADGTDVEKI